jgi:hypothetical protein
MGLRSLEGTELGDADEANKVSAIGQLGMAPGADHPTTLGLALGDACWAAPTRSPAAILPWLRRIHSALDLASSAHGTKRRRRDLLHRHPLQ